jgi:tetratricopeptide (TPR) repeat protein
VRTPATTLLAFALLAAAPAAAHQEAAAPAPAAGLTPALVAAAEALGRWDVAAARAALGPAGASPSAAEVLLRADTAYHDGEYEEAVRLLGAAPVPAAGEGALGPIARAALEMRRRLVARESEHFVLWHDAALDWVLVEPALEALEAAYRASGEWLGDRPPAKVRVEVVPTAEDFERVSSLARTVIESSGAVAVCKFNKIMLLSPRLLLRGYPWRDTLAHEYLHYLQVRLSANRAPIWLQEGVARYGERRWRGGEPGHLDEVDRSLLARASRAGALIAFSAMDPSLVYLPNAGAVRLAFAECTLAVEHLVSRWGDDGLRRLLAELARGGPYRGIEPALRAALGVSLEELETGWRALLAGKGFVETPGIAVPAYRLAGAGAAEEWDLADWQPLQAQNHLRLGDVLRQRGNARAGLMEYERALRAAPASPFARVKAARALLELGRAAEAAEQAREAARLAPEYPGAQTALAAADAALGDFAGAEAALRAALEVNPFDPYAWRDLGDALARQGRGEEARRPLETALRLARDVGTVNGLMRGGQ